MGRTNNKNDSNSDDVDIDDSVLDMESDALQQQNLKLINHTLKQMFFCKYMECDSKPTYWKARSASTNNNIESSDVWYVMVVISPDSN
jgi:hypothetical protein